MSGFLVVIPILALVLIIFLVSQAYERHRTEGWRTTAEDLGIEFLGDANGVLSEFGHMKIFQQGRSRRVRNAIVGETGDVRMTLGDFRYRTGGGKNSSTHHRTFCVLQSTRLHVPRCYLRPEVWLFDDLGSLLGGQDIDFEEDPGFSRAYVLQGNNETAIRALFTADVRAWFSERARGRFHFEAENDTLVFHTGQRRRPEEARELMQQALEILNLFAEQGG